MPSAHVAAAATGLPEVISPLFPVDRLERLPIRMLFDLSRVLRAASDLVGTNMICAGSGAADDACRMLEDLSGVLVGAHFDISEIAKRYQPANATEANLRGWIILDHACFAADELADITAAASEAAVVRAEAPSAHH